MALQALAAPGLVRAGAGFRMALLSGEVETETTHCLGGWLIHRGSGWLCYPGKLKPDLRSADLSGADLFRMALLSGEVETLNPKRSTCRKSWPVPDGFAIRGS